MTNSSDVVFKINSVCMVGLGYIGLPTAAVLANNGIKVNGLDISKYVVDTINEGKIHIVEPGLENLVNLAVKNGMLSAHLKPVTSDVYLIAVPTPFKENHIPDVSYVESAATSISSVLKKGDVVILESTSPVGTTEAISRLLTELRPDLKIASEKSDTFDVAVAYCPERVLPGQVIRELVENDRVIGGINKKSALLAQTFYKLFVKGECIITNARTAEMTKLTENSFRDVNIAFANELSIICDEFDINAWELIQLANRHPRVNILQPGPGVGGHCISVDPWFIVHQSKNAKLIHAARKVNDSKPHFVLSKIDTAVAKLKSPKVAFFGLSFKANIDDLRESPSMEIVETFKHQNPNVEVMAIEPYVETLPAKLGDMHIEKVSINEGLERADVLVLLVDHKEFKEVSRQSFQGKTIIDTRGIWL